MSMIKDLAEKICNLKNWVQRNLNNKLIGEFQNRREPTW